MVIDLPDETSSLTRRSSLIEVDDGISLMDSGGERVEVQPVDLDEVAEEMQVEQLDDEEMPPLREVDDTPPSKTRSGFRAPGSEHTAR